jgi:hypothetical protein
MVDRDRRYLAKNCLSLGIGIGGVVGAELWARRFGNPLYDISPETDLDIKNRAETIVPYLSFENFEREYPMGDKRVRIVPNQEEISRDILRLAYKDGGQTYYERIQNLLKESGLIIRMSDLTAMGLAADAIPSIRPTRTRTLGQRRR